MADELTDLLSSLGEDFESTNFETDKDFNLIRKISAMKPHVQKQIFGALVKQTANRGGGQPAGSPGAGTGLGAYVNSLVEASCGDLNLTVSREGVNIPNALPYILFGSNDFAAKYASTLGALVAKAGLPNGTTYTVTSEALTGDVLFTYTNPVGPVTDVVRVHNMGNVNYTNFLASMNNNYFATKYILFSVSDETKATQQFAQPIIYGLLSSLGLLGSNQLILRSRTNSWMFRKDRVESVMPEQKIVPDFSFASSIIAVDTFEVGWDVFMSQRWNLNKA